MTAKRLVAVDFGASGGKCFAGKLEDGTFTMEEIHRFDHEGISFFLDERTGDETERTYWDDTLLYANILKGLRAYRREVADTLDSLAIDTWGADGQLVSVDGDVLGKMYCYRDHRLDHMIEVVKSRIDADRVYAITGIHFQPFNVSNQLHWLVTNRPELLLPGCHYLPVPALFYHYLCGSRRVDSSWASVTQLMDAKERCWSREILEKLGIPESLMPEIVEPGTVMGTLRAPLAESLGLPGVQLIAAAAHDTASAFAAAPVEIPEESLIISSGTWSLVGKLLPQPITTPDAMAANISNEGGIGNTRVLKNCMGTWLLQELRRVWAIADGKPMPWGDIEAQVEAAAPFAHFIDPDDAGFYNPANMEEAIRDYCARTGQASPADRGAILRTVYEGLALKYRAVNEDICRVSGTETRALHIVGGGSKDKLLNQFAADSLGLAVVAGPEEATAVGNFMVQAMGLGLIANMQEAQPIIRAAFPISRHEPGDVDAWNAAYPRFRAVCGLDA